MKQTTHYQQPKELRLNVAKLLAREHHAHKTQHAGVSFYIYPLFMIPLRAIKTEQ